MSRFRPTPEQERWSALVARLGIDRRSPWVAGRLGGWTRVALPTRCAFFVLGLVAAALSAGILSLLHLPGAFLVTGVMLVVVAEAFIRQRRFFGTGIEEALELSGLLLVAFQILDASHDPHELYASLLLTLALLLAGLRLLNPLCIALAGIAFSYSVAALAQTLQAQRVSAALAAAAICFALATFALTLGAREFRRPSHDRMLDWLVVALPIAGYLWVAPRYQAALSLQAILAPGATVIATLILPLLYALGALLVGIRRRSHAPLLACIGCLGCVAYELREVTGLSLQARLIAWGGVALLVAVLLERYLRTPRRGITSATAARSDGALGLLQLAGASALTPRAAAPGAPEFKGGGGTFSGGGASGDY